MENSQQPHSAEYLGEYRDYWWNPDFLELMAKRWHLEGIKSILDVGCGVGHWGNALSKLLPAGYHITGIDMEEKWIEEAKKRSAHLKEQFEYKVSSAEEIPYPDQSFDMVTCQTVLLHVPDAVHVLKEMYRVLKPGGLLLVAEPNNSVSELVFDSLSFNEPAEDTIKAMGFSVTCERGQQQLGLGFSSIADIMPGYFRNLGLNDIKVYLSDKTSPLFPPYKSKEQQAFIRQLEDWYEGEYFVWDKNQSKKYFLAGGGKKEDFEETWQFLKERFRRRLEAIKNDTYSTAGGCLLYLISGRKKGSL